MLKPVSVISSLLRPTFTTASRLFRSRFRRLQAESFSDVYSCRIELWLANPLSADSSVMTASDNVTCGADFNSSISEWRVAESLSLDPSLSYYWRLVVNNGSLAGAWSRLGTWSPRPSLGLTAEAAVLTSRGSTLDSQSSVSPILINRTLPLDLFVKVCSSRAKAGGGNSSLFDSVDPRLCATSCVACERMGGTWIVAATVSVDVDISGRPKEVLVGLLGGRNLALRNFLGSRVSDGTALCWPDTFSGMSASLRFFVPITSLPIMSMAGVREALTSSGSFFEATNVSSAIVRVSAMSGAPSMQCPSVTSDGVIVGRQLVELTLLTPLAHLRMRNVDGSGLVDDVVVSSSAQSAAASFARLTGTAMTDEPSISAVLPSSRFLTGLRVAFSSLLAANVSYSSGAINQMSGPPLNASNIDVRPTPSCLRLRARGMSCVYNESEGLSSTSGPFIVTSIFFTFADDSEAMSFLEAVSDGTDVGGTLRVAILNGKALRPFIPENVTNPSQGDLIDAESLSSVVILLRNTTSVSNLTNATVTFLMSTPRVYLPSALGGFDVASGEAASLESPLYNVEPFTLRDRKSVV